MMWTCLQSLLLCPNQENMLDSSKKRLARMLSSSLGRRPYLPWTKGQGRIVSASVLLPWAPCTQARSVFSLFPTFTLTNAPSACLAHDKQVLRRGLLTPPKAQVLPAAPPAGWRALQTAHAPCWPSLFSFLSVLTPQRLLSAWATGCHGVCVPLRCK